MNNKPYFENVYIYGDLYLDKVLLEYEFFSYSILKDNKGNFFVCYCYEVEKRQSWLINEIKIDDLISFLLNKIDIKSIFLLGDSEKIIITRNYDSGKEKSESANTNKIIKMSILPDENEFLDKKEELYKYIIKLYYNLFEEITIYNNMIENINSYNIKAISDTKSFYTIQISKKINNSDIVNSSSVVFSENNGIDSYKPVIAASIMGACMGSFFDSINILESKKRKNKNYAKAT
ncbi:hypothetical protein [uncultured Brachyspira sp.]|jgi:hypothetical protein|uniref:hypothetical protein n=1 Tax=uncultured Brachyspira sp. TaxID=221953 RepID=UPI00320B4212